MSNSQSISLASMVAELQRLCQEKLSGNMNVLGANRQIARIGLMDGKIVALFCTGKRGMEALPLIQQLNPNWFQFINGSSTTTDPNLPPTSDIFNLLASVTSASTNSGSAKNTLIETLPQQTLAILKETLAEFMGPVAPMICNKTLRQAWSLDLAIDSLAREIPDRQQALQFKELVIKKLG